MQNELIATSLVIAYGIFCWFIVRRHQKSEQLPSILSGQTIIAYGSQTGTAQQLAENFAARFPEASPVSVITLNQFTKLDLSAISQLIIITSTYGEGDAPDNAANTLSFLTDLKPENALTHIRYAILGLGDKSYAHFCGFACQLDEALNALGASSVEPLAALNGIDESFWDEWQIRLANEFSIHLKHTPNTNGFIGRTLLARHWLNAGSQGAPVFNIVLEHNAGEHPAWVAGDIAVIQPENTLEEISALIRERSLGRPEIINALKTRNLRKLSAIDLNRLNSDEPCEDIWLRKLRALPTRQYSIASIPEEGSLQLLVRQQRDDDGNLGLGSGFLTQHAVPQQLLHVMVRANESFHPAPLFVPLILIGNGTGIAGLRAHLAYRAEQQQRLLNEHKRKATVESAWLFFGERNRTQDRHFSEDLAGWQKAGLLNKINVAFSRDIEVHRYVQDLIAPNAAGLREWVGRGAYVYVCGSLSGMAAGVDRELERALGFSGMKKLKEEGRYRRDVY